MKPFLKKCECGGTGIIPVKEGDFETVVICTNTHDEQGRYNLMEAYENRSRTTTIN